MSIYHKINRDYARGYCVTESGAMDYVNVLILDDKPCDSMGVPLLADNEFVNLIGWPDSLAASFCHGSILVALAS